MKIIFATSSFFHAGGGISSYANDFVNIYNKEHSLSVLTGDNYNKTKYDNFDLHKVDFDDLSLKNASETIALINLINPDIILNSNAQLISFITPYLSDSIKIVSISHFVKGQLAHTAGFNSKYIDTIISLSEFGSDYLYKKFNIKNKNKVRCIYNFLEEKENASDLLVNKKIYEKLIIVYPGGCSVHKSPDIVFKVVKNLLKTDLNFTFYWLGDTTLPMASCSFRHKTIKKLFEFDKRLIFTDRVNRNESVDIIESANIFFLPSRGEGCPISLLEAIRVGTIPIVSDSQHASSELISDGFNGYVIPINNTKEYINQIQDIINNHDKYQHIYESGLKFFSENLNSNVWKIKMDDLFKAENDHHKRLVHIRSAHFFLNRFKIRYILKVDRCLAILRSINLYLFFQKYIIKYFKI